MLNPIKWIFFLLLPSSAGFMKVKLQTIYLYIVKTSFSNFFIPVFIARDRCTISCRPVGFSFYARIVSGVPDGSICYPTSDHICVNGLCKVRTLFTFNNLS